MVVSSMYHGERKAVVLDTYNKNGIPMYLVDLDGLGEAEVTAQRVVRKARMTRSFSEQVDHELAERAASDESTETTAASGSEVSASGGGDMSASGGDGVTNIPDPAPLTPEEMNMNPVVILEQGDQIGASGDTAASGASGNLVNQSIMDEMGAKDLPATEFDERAVK